MIGEVLIVDDTPENLQVLSAILREEGLLVRLAPSGAFALRSVQARHPDLILLDIRMPEMDGFVVCQRLRDDPATAHIPVLFLSASQEPDERLEAFNVGGLDFIPKPFLSSEVLARVSTHLSIARLRRDLAKANFQLSSQVVDEQHQRRQAENIAEDRQVRLEMALNAAGMGTWIANGPDGHIQFDQQAQQLLALHETYLSGGWRDLVDGFAPANQADFTCLGNFTGAPALSLPLPVPADALPVGLQIMTRCGEDARLLDLSAALERTLAASPPPAN